MAQKFQPIRWKILAKRFACAAGLGTVGVVGFVGLSPAYAGDLHMHPSYYHWSHDHILASLDAASLRRGYQVYKQVCAACHSISGLRYRHFVDVFMTEEQAKAEAAEAQVEDGPDETGAMFMRPGKLTDPLPVPYANDEAAKAANNGALPPDLTLIVLSRKRHNTYTMGEDYIFSLLTSYKDPPAGVQLDEGQAYNPYFRGGKIGMAQQLFSESVEFEDGTPATVSQMAKDVSTFLRWSAEPFHDRRKRVLLKVALSMPLLLLGLWYWKRLVWNVVKTRRVAWKRPRPLPRR